MRIVIILILIFSGSLNAQHTDIEGDTRILGKLEILKSTIDSSIYIGANAGRHNMYFGGSPNISIGSNSGSKTNSSGGGNTMVGTDSGKENIDGDTNSFFGHESGQENIRGSENSFFGAHSGYNNNGAQSSFFGSHSGLNNKNGNANAFFGAFAGGSNINGSYNTYLGHGAGVNSANGDGNTFIGNSSGIVDGQDSLTQAIAIGNNARVACHNCAVIGGTGSDAVSVGIGTTAPRKEIDVYGYGMIGENLLASDNPKQIILGRLNEPVEDAVLIIGDGGDIDARSNAMIISRSGSVGIGTNNPTSKLEVIGGVRARELEIGDGLLGVENTTVFAKHMSISTFVRLTPVPTSDQPDCDANQHIGRVYFDRNDQKLKVCIDTGSSIKYTSLH